MLKQFAILKKKESLTHEEFARYWFEVHAPFARKMPGLRKYVISLTSTPPGREPEYNGVAELWFDDFNALKQSWSSPEGQAAANDVQNFVGASFNIYATEHVVLG